VTCIFKIFQERADHPGVELLQRKRRGGNLEPFGGELKQELETACIGITRVLAGASLMRKVLAKEHSNVGCERCHF
jgi:hypothetical protein